MSEKETLFQALRQARCRVLGHRWTWRGELKYAGCWTCDEVCSRCGGESWWPS